MSNKEKHQEESLDFSEAKELTVGEATRKSEELAAGVTTTDNALEKYIKQHREEIETGKFQAKSEEESQTLAAFIEEQRKEEPEQAAAPVYLAKDSSSHSTPGVEGVPLVSTETASESQKTGVKPVLASEEVDWKADEKAEKRKRRIFYACLLIAVLLIGWLVIGYNWLTIQNSKGGKVSVSTSLTSSSNQSSSTSSSSSALDKKEKAFTDLYNSFFTDSTKTNLKNSSFGNLDQLKTALEDTKDSSKYETYKKQYDELVKQVTAVQAVNSQFETAAITDGVLDTNAKAKSAASFDDTKTGNSKLDELLSSAITQGRNQLAAAPAAKSSAAGQATESAQTAQAGQTGQATTGGAGITDSTSQTSQVNTASSPASTSASNADIVVNGAKIQRSLSRVPYNQTVIGDTNNSAWAFNPGVLDKILQTSRQRGYFTGDNYFLERVNIINGNGYYNLFKSDGTYLFSINCKTGYFVGNAQGHADALDY